MIRHPDAPRLPEPMAVWLAGIPDATWMRSLLREPHYGPPRRHRPMPGEFRCVRRASLRPAPHFYDFSAMRHYGWRGRPLSAHTADASLLRFVGPVLRGFLRGPCGLRTMREGLAALGLGRA
jgi:hypothetical protein